VVRPRSSACLNAFAVASAFTWIGCPRPPIEFGPEGQIFDGSRLVALLNKDAESRRGIKAAAKVSVESPTQKGSVDELLSASRPANLHLETLDFFGRPVALLVTSGGRFAFFDSGKNEVTRGPASADNLARILPLTLAPADAVALLLGVPGPIESATPSLALDEGRRAYVLTLSGASSKQTIVADTRDLKILEMDLQGSFGYRVEYDKFEEGRARRVAHRIRLSVPERGTRVEVSLSDVELNAEDEPGLFTFAAPAGARSIEVDAEGRILPTGQSAPR